MRDKLIELVCESRQTDECVGHCNHPYCYEVERIADHLIANNVFVLPEKLKDSWELALPFMMRLFVSDEAEIEKIEGEFELKEVKQILTDIRDYLVAWRDNNAIDYSALCGGNYLIDKEFCLYFRKGVRLNTRFETAFTYWQSPKNKSDKDSFAHPTCKPTFILKMLIENSSNEGDIVLDTFGGSGSTCISAKELNRNFVAFEINPKWVKVANDRLNNIDANGQMSFFAR